MRRLTNTISTLVMALAFMAVTGLPNTAEARDARCRIFQDGRMTLDRICDFQPDGRNGSFSLTGRGGRGSLLPGISIVSVSVIEPGIAEVRGLTRGGINSRWGEARRSSRDRACWDGAGFRVCVY